MKAILFLFIGLAIAANAMDICDNKDIVKCKKDCKDKFGAKFIEAECKQDHAAKKRECSCKYKKEEAGELKMEERVDDEDKERQHPKAKPHPRPAVKGEKDRHTETPRTCSAFPKLVPLNQLYHLQNGNHFFAADFALYLATKAIGYIDNGGIIAHVAVNPTGCGDNKLVPIYEVQRNAPIVDIVYVRGDQLDGMLKAGYAKNRVAFYCSSKSAPECGATFLIDQYEINKGHHIIATNREYMDAAHIKTGTGVHQGVLCYAWPMAGGVQQ